MNSYGNFDNHTARLCIFDEVGKIPGFAVSNCEFAITDVFNREIEECVAKARYILCWVLCMFDVNNLIARLVVNDPLKTIFGLCCDLKL